MALTSFPLCYFSVLAFPIPPLKFPVKLAFALTIDKVQVSLWDSVGLDLTSLVFTHGQLHLALSRGTSSSKIAVLHLRLAS